MNPVTQTDRSQIDRGVQTMHAAPVSPSAQSAQSAASVPGAQPTPEATPFTLADIDRALAIATGREPKPRPRAVTDAVVRAAQDPRAVRTPEGQRQPSPASRRTCAGRRPQAAS
jgi:hypothetical protein